MKNTNYRPLRLFLALAAAMIFASAVSAQTVNGCADKNTGYLRRIVPPAVCKSGEIPITWNIQGPSGSQGVQGPVGPAGPQGLQGVQGLTGNDGQTGATGPASPAGISEAWTVSGQPGDSSRITVNVPAGSYVINARAYGITNGDATMTCNLSTGDYTSVKLPGFGSVSLQDTAIFNAPAAITLQCGGINVIVTNAKLTAIKVDAIH